MGGDLYDFFPLDENRVCFMIGDVSDKGVPAALFMAMVRTAFRISATAGGDSAASTLRTVNRFLYENNESQMFVTMFTCILDRRTGLVEYSDGGHEPPFVLRAGGAIEMLEKKSGIALGFLDDYEFPEGTIQLGPGDSLLLYTDGVNEAMNFQRDLFKTTGIQTALLPVSSRVPAETVTLNLMRELSLFVGGAPQSDDITVMVVRYCGRQ